MSTRRRTTPGLTIGGGLVTIPAPILGGLIWRELGPAYVFLVPVMVDLLLRIRLLTTVPETLNLGGTSNTDSARGYG